VVIDHGNGLQTFYYHLETIKTQAGLPIKEGEVIGTVGSTGKSTGSHLYFEVRRNGVAVDPGLFVSSIPMSVPN
jgi:murein DD-endopeptidase MepM/ murein hydrolase activator NlpD